MGCKHHCRPIPLLVWKVGSPTRFFGFKRLPLSQGYYVLLDQGVEIPVTLPASLTFHYPYRASRVRPDGTFWFVVRDAHDNYQLASISGAGQIALLGSYAPYPAGARVTFDPTRLDAQGNLYQYLVIDGVTSVVRFNLNAGWEILYQDGDGFLEYDYNSGQLVTGP